LKLSGTRKNREKEWYRRKKRRSMTDMRERREEQTKRKKPPSIVRCTELCGGVGRGTGVYSLVEGLGGEREKGRRKRCKNEEKRERTVQT